MLTNEEALRALKQEIEGVNEDGVTYSPLISDIVTEGTGSYIFTCWPRSTEYKLKEDYAIYCCIDKETGAKDEFAAPVNRDEAKRMYKEQFGK